VAGLGPGFGRNKVPPRREAGGKAGDVGSRRKSGFDQRCSVRLQTRMRETRDYREWFLLSKWIAVRWAREDSCRPRQVQGIAFRTGSGGEDRRGPRRPICLPHPPAGGWRRRHRGSDPLGSRRRTGNPRGRGSARAERRGLLCGGAERGGTRGDRGNERGFRPLAGCGPGPRPVAGPPPLAPGSCSRRRRSWGSTGSFSGWAAVRPTMAARGWRVPWASSFSIPPAIGWRIFLEIGRSGAIAPFGAGFTPVDRRL